MKKAITSRKVTRYFAGGKGYASAWQAYRGIAKQQLRDETISAVWQKEPYPSNPCWFNREQALFDRSQVTETPGDFTLEHRRRYPTNADWQRAIDKRAEELRCADTEQKES